MARQSASGFRTPLVTSLPASPFDGQEIRYLADAANGIVWTLRYRAASASAYKWEFVGGGDLYSEVVANEATSATSYVDLTTVGPSVALPLAGDYDVEIGAKMAGNADAVNVYMSYAIGATAASDNDLINRQANGAGYAGPHDARVRRKPGLAVVMLTAKYKVGNVSGNFGYRWMRASPVRVG